MFPTTGQGATGGNFWDGRATGELLGNPAADQALGPFLNPKEQAMLDQACVIWDVPGAGRHRGLDDGADGPVELAGPARKARRAAG